MIATQTLLTFDELWDKCLRHLQEVTALCPGGFTNPDPDFLTMNSQLFVKIYATEN
ncbi:hypothetical protein [Nostoc sp. FACHB-190]|uniref:hypothetical protein n=1 Tax=Nostoc sp. FACHB-190 TaxID=2692838 RepID=UPI0016827C20|nr:hypothetical protein [Nostoc sp. FACHB-190]MBD2303468.1 hypothetical protein [Nostoc sp. FACHB-190]